MSSGVIARRIRQTIVSTHRWIGIIVCVLMLVWFISGWVLAYVRFPAMPAGEKLEQLPAIAWSQVKVSPADALRTLGLTGLPHELRLEMSGSQPVYRAVDWRKRRHAVSAVTGEIIEGVSPEAALRIVREQMRRPEATLMAAHLDSDQWTVTSSWNSDRPFHLIALNDAVHQRLYVSEATGEIVLDTRRSERVLNWFGAIPHWLYFEFLRHYSREPVWRWVIYILAGAGIAVSISGLYLGISRGRWRERYANGDWSPFVGWMRWHHVLGIVGGVFLTAWTLSGFWTMYPGGVLKPREISQVELQTYRGQQDGKEFSCTGWSALGDAQAASGSPLRRVTFAMVGGRSLALLEGGGSPSLVDCTTRAPVKLAANEIETAAAGLVKGSRVTAVQWLAEGDEYWHSGFRMREVPIWRVAFDDDQGTWYHIEPRTGLLKGVLDRSGRINRWTVIFAHNVDVQWLTARRPLWDVTMFAVTIPAALLVLTAMVIGYRRLQRVAPLTRMARVGAGFATDGKSNDGAAAQPSDHGPASEEILVTFASQTGTAELIAGKVATALRRSLHTVKVVQLGELTSNELATYARAIFVVSTTGDGDPPDRAAAFQRRAMTAAPNLVNLRYAILALGDYEYREFCAFGNQIDRWLRRCGARPMFEPIRVDDLSPVALSQWGRELAILTGSFEDFTIQRVPYSPWRLVDRRLINPGSAGGEAYHLEFAREGSGGNGADPRNDLGNEPRDLQWDAGDIAQLVAATSWSSHDPRSQTAVEREYSLASIPSAGRAHLLVRRMIDSHGRPGLSSGYLTQQLAVGDAIPMRIRSNPTFHGPPDDRPILLIGNGTGIAGLRAHLQRRELLGHRRNWLLFGERNANRDAFYADDLKHWVGTGNLERLDLAYSRDQDARRYVQHLVREAAEDVRRWLDDGASIYVCGSLAGMAAGVTSELVTILGETGLDALVRSGRYRRDVY